MRKRFIVVPAALGILVLAGLLVASLAVAGGGKKNLKAHGGLSGYQENPDVFTSAVGSFKISIGRGGDELTYTLDYSGLEGTVTQAHVHFGKRAVNGGVSFFLCGTAASPGPPGTPTCPQSGTVTRTIDASAVIGPGGQGIQAGQLDKVIQALRDGHMYANVHSTMWPGGEIRGQINDPDQRN